MNTVSFTPDGTALISGSDDRTIKIWDWSKGVPLLSYHSGHRNNVFQARALPHSDNNVIVSCAADGQVSLTITTPPSLSFFLHQLHLPLTVLLPHVRAHDRVQREETCPRVR